MSDDGDWFVYDKSTARIEDGELHFDIVETGLTKTEAEQKIIFKTGKTMAKLPGDVERTPDVELSRSQLADRHNGGRGHCVNCGGSLSRERIKSDGVTAVHEGC